MSLYLKFSIPVELWSTLCLACLILSVFGFVTDAIKIGPFELKAPKDPMAMRRRQGLRWFLLPSVFFVVGFFPIFVPDWNASKWADHKNRIESHLIDSHERYKDILKEPVYAHRPIRDRLWVAMLRLVSERPSKGNDEDLIKKYGPDRLFYFIKDLNIRYPEFKIPVDEGVTP